MEKAEKNIHSAYILIQPIPPKLNDHNANMKVICAMQPGPRFGRFRHFLNKAIGAIGDMNLEEQYGDNESHRL